MLLPLALLTIVSLTHATSNVTNAIPVFSDSKTWIENLAVRKSNGYILPATATSAVLYQVDPVSKEQKLVHNFSDYGNAIMSIADVGPDLFLINTMDCDIYKLACTAGTGITWRVDLTQTPARVKQLSKGPDPKSLLNGAAALNSRTVLMVDQALGGIWAVNIWKGDPKLVIQIPSMNDTSSQGNGVNGIRVRGSTLYFNNPSQGILARIPIDPITGERKGEVTIIASGLSPDDFEIDEERGVCYIVDPDQSALLKVSLKDGKSEAVAGGLAGPTTARWKVYGKELYVATTGGYDQWLAGNPSTPAVVYKVDV